MDMPKVNDSHKRILFIAQFGILIAIEAIVCFITPLGSIPIGPLVATLSHIPVIVTAVILGTGAGAAMGFFYGLFSCIVWTVMPPSPIAFAFTPFYSAGEISGNFWSLVICFVPRILVGIVTGLSFRFFSGLFKKNAFAYSISGVLGSLTNTLLVLGGIYLFFGQDFADVNKIGYHLLFGFIGMIFLTNGIPEAVIGAITAYAVGRPMRRINEKTFKSI